MQQNLLNWHLVALYVSQTFYPCVHQVRDIEHNLAFHERVADLVSLFAHFVPFSDKWRWTHQLLRAEKPPRADKTIAEAGMFRRSRPIGDNRILLWFNCGRIGTKWSHLPGVCRWSTRNCYSWEGNLHSLRQWQWPSAHLLAAMSKSVSGLLSLMLRILVSYG